MKSDYLMESKDEILRLEMKTDADEVRRNAEWCGIKPGMTILDLGCGTGRTTHILHEMIQPGGKAVGVDSSSDRIEYARKHYGNREGIEFHVRDVHQRMDDLGAFDMIWVRFLLEYFRAESPDIVRGLVNALGPGGGLCLLDLDQNCLNHYELHRSLDTMLNRVMERLEEDYNFDAHAGRKLYSYLYDEGLEHIDVHIMPHHLIYGEIEEKDAFNWVKKVEMAALKVNDLFEEYPGGREAFFEDFTRFFHDPRRFTYSCLILCKGHKPRRS